MKKSLHIKLMGLLFLVGMMFCISLTSAQIALPEVVDTQRQLNPFGDLKVVLEPITDDYVDSSDFMLAETSDYPFIKIDKGFLWLDSGDLAEYKITDNGCAMNYCNMRVKVRTHEDVSLIDELVKVTDLNSNKDTSINTRWFIRGEDETYSEEVIDYKKECEILKNNTESCKNVIVGSHLEERIRETWKPYNYEVMPSGEYELDLRGQIPIGSSLDVKPYAQSYEFTEWAVWQDSYSVGLKDYWNFSSGEDLINGTNNITTNTGSGISYISENALIVKSGNITQSNTGQSTFNSNWFTGTTTPVAISLWVRSNATSCADENSILNNYAGGGQGWLLNTNGGTYDIAYWTVPDSQVTCEANKWTHLVINRNATTTCLIKNDTDRVCAANGNLLASGQNLHFGAVASTDTLFWGGMIDEVAIWNRSLSSAEVTALYNNGAGITYTTSGEVTPVGTYVTTSLLSPINLTNTTSQTNIFNVSCNPSNGNLTNANLTIWNATDNSIYYQYNNVTSQQNTSKNFTYSVSMVDGNFNWNAECFITNGTFTNSSLAPNNYSLMIDSTAPSLNIVSPKGQLGIVSLPYTTLFNYTSSDLHLQSCWYNTSYNSTIYSITCNQNMNINVTNGNYNSIYLYANDTFGNTNSAVSNFYPIGVYNLTYNSTTYESSIENFNLNFQYNSSAFNNIYANLIYNNNYNVVYTTDIGNNINFSKDIVIPSIINSTNLSFYWIVSLVNSTGTYNYSTSYYNQSINKLTSVNITSGNCTNGLTSGFYFDLKDEVNLTSLYGNVNYIFIYGLSGNSSAISTYGSFTNVNNFSICINSSSPTYTLNYGEIQYSIEGHSNRRFYLFSNTRLTNQTINNTLYGLESGLSTPFQITSTTTSLIPYDNNYLSLLRWYPNLNQYNIVEMGKNDDLGQTVFNVKTNDVDYRIGLYERDGTLIKLINPLRMVCQTTPCVYSIITSGEELDLTGFLNIQSNLSFDSTLKRYTFIWNDPSQDTTLMNLKVYNDRGTASILICNQTSTGFTGVLTCDVSNYTGILRAEAWRSASPANLLDQSINEIRATLNNISNGSDLGLFFGFLLVTTFALIGLISPIMVVVLSIIALIPSLILGNITLGIFMIITAIGGVILQMLRRSQGN